METENRFTIGSKLPSLNEYISACRRNPYGAAAFKKRTEETILRFIRAAVAKGDLRALEQPCTVEFVWHEKTRKRDCDNVASAKKFILDALQKGRILINDSPAYVQGFTDRFVYDGVDGVEVTLTPTPPPPAQQEG